MNRHFQPPKIMGILNITDDSFYDGGRYISPDKAVAQAMQMIEDGADIIDIGGESTRPGSRRITSDEEIDRIIPILQEIKKRSKIEVSVDTYKPAVARRAVESGADIINDVYALRYDPQMAEILRHTPHIKIILMHMQGDPSNMQDNPHYEDVVEEIKDFFNERIAFCTQNGIHSSRLILDPGIGFGKTPQDNITILENIDKFHSFGLPLLIGASRKSFLGSIYTSTPEERLAGSLAVTALCGASDVAYVRVHDVKEHKQFIQTMSRIV